MDKDTISKVFSNIEAAKKASKEAKQISKLANIEATKELKKIMNHK